MTPFRELPAERQEALRAAYATEMAQRGGTCEMAEKITRFAAWLAPQGVSFGPEDLPQRQR